ncbi:MAG TPA: hypothetical protein VF486_23005, partial [Actinomycetes bacterium]
AVGLLLGLVVGSGVAWWLAWRRQAPAAAATTAGGLARPSWPHTAAPPGTESGAARSGLRAWLFIRRSTHAYEWPDSAAFPGARPAGARARLARVLRSALPKGRPQAATVTLAEPQVTSNGHHHTNGNGSGTLAGNLAAWPGVDGAGPSTTVTPHDPDGDSAPQQG